MKDAIEEVAEIEGKTKNLNPVFAGCYFAAKRKYAQEIQYLFFMGE